MLTGGIIGCNNYIDNLNTSDAILMASGYSVRFGMQNKLLVPFRGKALMAHTLDLVCSLAEHFGKIYVVAAEPPVCALAREYPVEILQNKTPGRGQCESIRLGVCASKAEYYLFFPCDQPLLDKDMVLRVLEKRKPGVIASPAYRGQPGSPTLFSSIYRQELLNLPEGENARVLKKKYPQCVETVPVSSPRVLLDIDTPEDLRFLAR